MQPSSHVSVISSNTLPIVNEIVESAVKRSSIPSSSDTDSQPDHTSTHENPLSSAHTITSSLAPTPTAQKSSANRRRGSLFSSTSSMSSATSIPGINTMIGVPSPNGMYSNEKIDTFSSYSQYPLSQSDLYNSSANNKNPALATPSANTHSRYGSSGFNTTDNHNQTTSSNKNLHTIQSGRKIDYVPQAYGGNGVFAETEKLRQDLELEQMETANLDRQLRETRKKLEHSLNIQSQLENDVVDMAKEMATLQAQVKDFKKTTHNLETELSQEQVNNLNEKQQWFDKEQTFEKSLKRLNDENSRLKALINEQAKALPLPTDIQLNNVNDKQLQSQLPEHNRYFSMNSFASFAGFGSNQPPSLPSSASSTSSSSSSPSSVNSTVSNSTTITSYTNPSPILSSFAVPSHSSSGTMASKDKTIERLKMELEQLKQQTELVSREYTIRHNQIEADLADQKAMVSKLMEENDSFQYLLAEKTVLGGFSNNGKDSEEENGPNYFKDEKHSVTDETLLDTNSDSKSVDTLTKSQTKLVLTQSNLTKGLERVSSRNDSESGSDSQVTTETSNADLQFEVQSLHNHNKALTLSLERLVHKLLEFKQFENGVENASASGSINAISISQFHTRVTAASANMRSNSVGSIGKRFNNGLLPTSSSFFRSGYLSNNGSSTQLNLQSTLPSPNLSHHQHGFTKPANLHFSKHSKHMARDSVSSTTSSMFSRSTRSLKSPSLWNNMLLGGSAPGGGFMGHGNMTPGSRLSMMSTSSLPFAQTNSNIPSPTLSEINLSMDGDATYSSNGKVIGKTAHSANGDLTNHSNYNATDTINTDFDHLASLSGSEDSDHHTPTLLLSSHHSSNGDADSSASSAISVIDKDDDDMIINEVEWALQDSLGSRRPSTNSQRQLKPLSIYAHSS